jgi:head-tail adaptor
MRGLDRKITVERRAASRDAYGQETETWTEVVARRSASIRPVTGEERFTSEQFISRQQVEFRVRWSQNLADLSPLDRIIYPPPGGSPPEAFELYDIIAVHEIGRREGLRIIAARRSEV